MQFNPPYFSPASPPKFMPYNPFSAPPYQHQCSTYPEVIGEGEVTSLVQPDGSVQLYFLPIISKWSVPYLPPPTTGCARCNANRVWFVRTVTTVTAPAPFPFTNPLFNTQPSQPYGALCQFPFGSNYEVQQPSPIAPPSPCPAFTFHDDKCTSSTDLQYFSPLQQPVTKAHNCVQVGKRCGNKSSQTEEKCIVNKEVETELRSTVQHSSGHTEQPMSIDEKPRQRSKKYKRDRSKRRRDKKKNIKKKNSSKRYKSSSTGSSGSDMSVVSSPYSNTGISSMSVDDSGLSRSIDERSSLCPCEYHTQHSCDCNSEVNIKNDKKDRKEKKKSKKTAKKRKSKPRDSARSRENCGVCESCKGGSKAVIKRKRKSKESAQSGENFEVCESCRNENKVTCEDTHKDSKTETKRSGSRDNCGVCESCTAYDHKSCTCNTISKEISISGIDVTPAMLAPNEGWQILRKYNLK